MALKEIRIYPGDFGMLGQNTDDDFVTITQARAILDSAEVKAKKDGLTDLRIAWRGREIWATKQETELEIAQRRNGILKALAEKALVGGATKEDIERALEEYCEIRLQWGDGHSGRGLYVSLAEYPEEGAVLLAREQMSADGGKAIPL